MSFRDAVAAVAAGERLGEEQAEEAMEAMAGGQAPAAQVASLLTAMHMRHETPEELAGFARAMRRHSVALQPACAPLVDTCGTGGGTVATFNISTCAAFVVAGAGVAVAKHGNRAMTSHCGSADVLEALGVRIDLSPRQVCGCIEEIGIGFLFAQAHHPAMKQIGPVRRELPFRTLFNCLGPLTNPAGAARQLIGVYEARLVPLLAQALRLLGTERAIVVHGIAGLDELSTLGPTLIADVEGDEIEEYVLTPDELDLALSMPESIAPGETIMANAGWIRSVLEGREGPRREIVLLNAAAALVAAGVAGNLQVGLRMSADSIDSGAAGARLEALVVASQAA